LKKKKQNQKHERKKKLNRRKSNPNRRRSLNSEANLNVVFDYLVVMINILSSLTVIFFLGIAKETEIKETKGPEEKAEVKPQESKEAQKTSDEEKEKEKTEESKPKKTTTKRVAGHTYKTTHYSSIHSHLLSLVKCVVEVSFFCFLKRKDVVKRKYRQQSKRNQRRHQQTLDRVK
jgi:cytoskeletal protein RodZ